jgi:hypothetical protein
MPLKTFKSTTWKNPPFKSPSTEANNKNKSSAHEIKLPERSSSKSSVPSFWVMSKKSARIRTSCSKKTYGSTN